MNGIGKEEWKMIEKEKWKLNGKEKWKINEKEKWKINKKEEWKINEKEEQKMNDIEELKRRIEMYIKISIKIYINYRTIQICRLQKCRQICNYRYMIVLLNSTQPSTFKHQTHNPDTEKRNYRVYIK